MFCGLYAKNHCPISNIENSVAKIQSVKFSFLLSIHPPFILKSNRVETLYKYVRVYIFTNHSEERSLSFSPKFVIWNVTQRLIG